MLKNNESKKRTRKKGYDFSRSNMKYMMVHKASTQINLLE